MSRRLLWALMLFIAMPLYALPAHAEMKPIGRTVLGVYDSRNEGDPRFSGVHTSLEMPLNYLGYKVVYQDVRQKLVIPAEDVVAAIVWLPDSQIDKGKEDEWLNYLNQLVDSGRKLIIIGGLGLDDTFYTQPTAWNKINTLWNKIGVHDNNVWIGLTYDTKFVKKDPSMMEFERRIDGLLEPYASMSAVNGGVSHLSLLSPQNENAVSSLVITHPKGGYIGGDYAVYKHVVDGGIAYRQWYVNPFLFLGTILDTPVIPKADVTTLNGRRIFYTHVDGDGWNNYSEMPFTDGKRRISAEMMRDAVIKKYTDFPFTIGITVQELLPQCNGLPFSEAVARDIFALPNVEPSSHTLSHPLYWGFFAEQSEQKEAPFLEKYPKRLSKKFFLSELISDDKEADYSAPQLYKPADHVDPLRGITSPHIDKKEVLAEYVTPRSFACSPFKLGDEVGGALRYTESLAGGKKVKLYQWSGDTKPFEAAIAEVRLHDAYNLNGGGSRYDIEAPSYTLVSAIGAPVGAERQIYSSNTNENDYTNLWTGRFFGFRYLKATVENTETPLRVHPFNIYFHSYSAQKQASLKALMDNFDYARTLDLAPIYASEYAAIANSFYDVELIKLSPMRWMVKNRGELQTIRFDQATLLAVDINKSKGVLGYKYLHGSMYVSLDKAVNNPIISLITNNKLKSYNVAKRPYLTESNWKIKSLKYIKNKLTFEAVGVGALDMIWKQPSQGKYEVIGQYGKNTIFSTVIDVSHHNLLHLHQDSSKPELTISITPLSVKHGK